MFAYKNINNSDVYKYSLYKSLEDNINTLKQIFIDDDTFKIKKIRNNHNQNIKYCIAYFEGLVDSKLINVDVIKPLIISEEDFNEDNIIDKIVNNILYIDEIKNSMNIKAIVEAVSYGDTLLLIDGIDKALILNTKGHKYRDILEPATEKVLSGPREGFNESLTMNISMIRRKARTNKLKVKNLTLGKETSTKISVCYLDDIVNKQILEELIKRLNKINIDGIIDSNYISEMIRDSSYSPFSTIGTTERPDVALAKMLEGRITLLVDGSPVALTLPYLFVENFQSNDDYYVNYYFGTFTRLIRILGFILTTCVPALYIAIVAFHHEMLPTPLFINIAIERQSVPLPAALECFIMLIIFEILKETGLRMPTNIGQALGIVGALVIGQAAVEARLVAAPMIIVVGLTGITGLLIPKLNAPIIIIRFILLLISSMFGLLGFILGLSFFLIHLLNLRSFGIPQLSSLGSFKRQDLKDSAVRSSWKHMIKRPGMITKNKTRKSSLGDNND